MRGSMRISLQYRLLALLYTRVHPQAGVNLSIAFAPSDPREQTCVSRAFRPHTRAPTSDPEQRPFSAVGAASAVYDEALEHEEAGARVCRNRAASH